MTRYEVLLFIHLLAAFATVASVVVLVTVLVGSRRAASAADAMPLLRLSNIGTMLWNVGGIGVLVFGVWLALDLDEYGILDGWIVAAIVLWLVASSAGGPLTRDYRTAVEAGGDTALATVRAQRTAVLHAVMALATLALLVVMIYKPGAG
jgi:hypothetical protein